MNQKHILIVGSGTAGLTTALILRSFFQNYQITVVSSEKIGIIGVGEGSTEHWRWFQDNVKIDVEDMIKEVDITHKYGIYYKDWTNHTPRYFHSVAGGPITVNNFCGSYAYALENDLLLTNKYSWRGLIENKIIREYDKDNKEVTHLQTNQYHFDTNKLNIFLKKTAADRGIYFIDDEVDYVRKDDDGFIESLYLKNNRGRIKADLFIDASGFNRVLMKEMEDQEFVSYKKYLPCDSALVFPTPPDPSGEIKPYTIARAMKNGWMWEIPTQERRGNGYVFSSDYCSNEEALKEVEETLGIKIDNPRFIKFKSGYWKKTWQKNCIAIGLSAGFIEPLEATSIATTIQQAKIFCSYIPTFDKESKFMIDEYHRIMDSVMENAVSMISLHYISDREDSEMWRNQKKMDKPELLKRLLGLWNERCPELQDLIDTGYELFSAVHMWHVAQGQGVINKEKAAIQLDAYGSRGPVQEFINDLTVDFMKKDLVDHAQALREVRDSKSEDNS